MLDYVYMLGCACCECVHIFFKAFDAVVNCQCLFVLSSFFAFLLSFNVVYYYNMIAHVGSRALPWSSLALWISEGCISPLANW